MNNNINSYLKGTSFTFKILYKLNLMRDIQKHGQISFIGLIWFTVKTILKRALFAYSYKGYFLEPLNKKIIRPFVWRFCGCKLGNNVHIGHMVRMDFGNTELITIGNNVVLSNGTTILCHKRDVTEYERGGLSTRLPFVYAPVVLKDNCQIGLNCTIMPGVTIGEGAIIGTNSLVTKDIPAWSIAVGSPAKVVKQL